MPGRRRSPRRRTGPRLLNERASIVGRHIFLACLLIGAVIAGVILFTAEYGGVVNSYGATIEGIFQFGLSQVEVGVELTNLGSSSATPTCRIEMNSPDRSDTGAWTFKANHPILGGSGTYFEMTVPVTTNGASSVTFGASNLSCQ
jgi:hypothetical protein